MIIIVIIIIIIIIIIAIIIKTGSLYLIMKCVTHPSASQLLGKREPWAQPSHR